jgi:hypothetical protein
MYGAVPTGVAVAVRSWEFTGGSFRFLGAVR